MNHTGKNGRCIDLNTYYQKKYDHYLFRVLDRLQCPHCHNPVGLRIHGRYLRNIYLTATKRIQIMVSRMICTCGKTFVVLPPAIIPFKRYILGTVLAVIKASKGQSVYYAEKRFEVASSLIRYWLRQFDQWHGALVKAFGLLESGPIEAAYLYNHYHQKRRLMQIISAWTQPFHDLFTNHIV
ncbi:DUF6431 domain-containing protein [Lentilactobacillus farraginis]|nr:DUF6431 domain-containing protein [Lentilactobacillus farraginis]